jgi:DNA-binding transcriptional MocR family regulator
MRQILPMQDSDAPVTGAIAPAWLAPLTAAEGPRYLQIADLIARALADGRLRPGDRLPPQRQLAALLRVDLTTVTRAYDEAKRRNLLVGRGARGTYAAAPKVALAPLIDLSMNIPPPPEDVDFDDMLKQGLAQVMMHNDSDQLMSYHLGGGSAADRAGGALWLAPMFGEVALDDIVVCPGAQAALAALILATTAPGDTIVCEIVVYPGLLTAAAQLGRRLVAVAVDADGMRPDAMEEACLAHGTRLVYLNPTLHNPTTRTMPLARRRAIVATAARCGALIIEDDPYSLLAAAAPPPLAQFAPRGVLYIATLSKCLTPGLRSAFVLLPEARVRERFLQALRSFALMSTPLTTALATQWIHDGSAARLLAGVRAEARARQRLVGQLLTGGADVDADGIHAWYTLPSYWTSRELAGAARAEGLAVTSSDVFQAGDAHPNAIRIALGGVKERARLAAGLRTLSRLLAREPGQRGEVII